MPELSIRPKEDEFNATVPEYVRIGVLNIVLDDSVARQRFKGGIYYTPAILGVFRLSVKEGTRWEHVAAIYAHLYVQNLNLEFGRLGNEFIISSQYKCKVGSINIFNIEIKGKKNVLLVRLALIAGIAAGSAAAAASTASILADYPEAKKGFIELKEDVTFIANKAGKELREIAELTIKGVNLVQKLHHLENGQARLPLERAAEVEPNYATAWNWLG